MESKENKESSELSSVQKLIQDSWKLFQETVVSYIKLFGLSFACLFLCVLVGILIALPLSFTAFAAHFTNFNHLTTFPLTMVVLFIIWIVICLIAIVIISLIFPVASILIFEQKNVSSVFDMLKQTRRHLLPYFGTSLLSWFVIFGGGVLFILPGILIGIFFSFTGYEVVLEGKSGRAALKGSYLLVKSHFWEVVIRVIILEVGFLIISSVLTHLAGKDIVISLVKFLFSVFSYWYTRAYFYLLYKQLKKTTTVPGSVSLLWIWIVSGAGWVFLVLIAGAFAFGVAHIPGLMHPKHELIVPHTSQNAV
jgi:hypothetical protein